MIRISKLVLLTIFVATLLCELASAQRPRTVPQRVRKYYLDEPRTRLEEVQDRLESVIYKGFMTIGNVAGRNGTAEIAAVELRSLGDTRAIEGLVIQLAESAQGAMEIQSFIDYDEIDPLIKGLDATAHVNDTITKMPNFSASYRTRDDFGIVVFKQTRSGIAVRLENSAMNGTGGIDRATVYITLDELNKLRGIILEAKQRLDEMK